MTINDEALEQLLKLLNQTRRGLMLVGQLPHPQEYNAILKFAQRLGWPVFPDILSSLRLGYDFTDIISYYDRLLHSPKFTDRIQPDTILHLGGQITSKRLFQFIENSPPENYILINNYPERHDPIHKVTYRLQGDIVPTLNRLFSSVNPNPDEKWLPLFSTGNKVIHEILDNLTVDYETINEPAIARLLSKSIADNSGLFIASSMPIRDMDMYASPDGFRIPTGANRGVSGIDGTVASASGFACGLQKPVTLYCGDLALLHDINSLALLKDSPYPVTVVVINNNGGGIFSFLPIAGYTDIFEKYFATPHHLYFNKAADLFGLNYYQPKNLKAFVDDYQTAQTSGRSSLIEIIVDRQENQQFYRTLQKKIVTRLDELYK